MRHIHFHRVTRRALLATVLTCRCGHEIVRRPVLVESEANAWAERQR